jgi:hypothetical protein
MGEMRTAYTILVGRRQFDDTGVDVGIISKWNLRNRVERCGKVSSGPGWDGLL